MRRLARSTKQHLDLVRAVFHAQKKLAECLELLTESGAACGKTVTRYREETARLDDTARHDYDAVYRLAVLEPAAKFAAVFPEVQETIDKRKRKLLDYDEAKAKVKSLVSHPSDDAAKLARSEEKCAERRKAFDLLNSQLVEGVPVLLGMSEAFFVPSLEAFLRAQRMLYEESAQCLQHSLRGYDAHRRFSAADAEGAMQRAHHDLRALKIVQ